MQGRRTEHGAGRVVRNGLEEAELYHALNDVVVARGAVSRVVTITGSIDDALVTTFRADAVILSTATGSTGYNLAVGGPILDPTSKSLVLKPVAAHMGLTAGLVLDPASKISLAWRGIRTPSSAWTGTWTTHWRPVTGWSWSRVP